MPLSEFYRMAKSKLESSQKKTTSSSDLSFFGLECRPDNEVVELVWGHGEILMQGQSDRARKNPVSKNFPFRTSNLQKDTMNAIISKMGNDGTVESIVHHIPVSVPSSEMDLGQNDDIFPWLYHPTDDTLQHDYFPEVLSDITANVSDVTVNEGNSCSNVVRDTQSATVNNMSLGEGNSIKVSASRIDRSYPCSLQQGQTLLPPHSGVSDNISTTPGNANCVASWNSVQGQESTGGFPSMIIKKLDSGHASNTPDLLNFSHFSRPAARFRANVQNTPAVVASCSAEVERLLNRDMVKTAGLNKNAESRLLDSSSSLLKEMHLYNQPVLLCSKVHSTPSIAKSLKQSSLPQQSASINNNMSANQIVGVDISHGGTDAEKTCETVVASSSACSGNSTDGASNDLTENMKRTRWDNEESECQSEDIEEESEGVNKVVPCQGSNGSKTGSKRSRSAEVHNLSERRRRDRINEKMRALQELIPNCNKVDKASMLDEAIEYMKTLQLQVQIMSMGAGLCMTPMMLPTGMQCIHTPHMPQFLPTNAGMGMGMGMGKGYGMGMQGMNSGPPGCPMIPVPPIQGLQFPSSPISGPICFQGISGSNFQFFGHPGNGLHMLVPGAPLIPSLGQPLVNSALGLNTSIGVPVPTLKPTDLMQKHQFTSNS